MESTEWIAFVLTGRKHDQLAQRPVSPFGHSFEPIRQLSRLHTGYSSNYLMVSDPVFDGFQPKLLLLPPKLRLNKYCGTPTNVSHGNTTPSPCYSRCNILFINRGLRVIMVNSGRFVRPPAVPSSFSSIRPGSGSIRI